MIVRAAGAAPRARGGLPTHTWAYGYDTIRRL
eukprot:SAG31_NODE_39168_length_290_cov_1.068063_1_plen_31_part_10